MPIFPENKEDVSFAQIDVSLLSLFSQQLRSEAGMSLDKFIDQLPEFAEDLQSTAAAEVGPELAILAEHSSEPPSLTLTDRGKSQASGGGCGGRVPVLELDS